MSRRKSRVLAFQALYSWDVGKNPQEDLLSFPWEEKTDAIAGDMDFAALITAGTIEHIKEIDSLIEGRLSANWSKDRLNKVTLALLRTSVYELKFQPDSNPGVVIDEAVCIAKKFDADDTYKFVNAVLDNIAKNDV